MSAPMIKVWRGRWRYRITCDCGWTLRRLKRADAYAAAEWHLTRCFSRRNRPRPSMPNPSLSTSYVGGQWSHCNALLPDGGYCDLMVKDWGRLPFSRHKDRPHRGPHRGESE